MEGTGRAAETAGATASQTARCPSQSERAICRTAMAAATAAAVAIAIAVATLQRRGVSPSGPAIAGLRST